MPCYITLLAPEYGKVKDYKKAMDILTEHFQLKKNIPQARQTFLTTTLRQGERINNFVTRLQIVTQHCYYNDEKDNQIRDGTSTFVTNKHLKAKLYQESDLTLNKLPEIVSSYHEALNLIPGNPNQDVNHLHISRSATQKFQWDNWPVIVDAAKVIKCGKVNHYAICCKSKPANTKNTKHAKPSTSPYQKVPHHINSVE